MTSLSQKEPAVTYLTFSEEPLLCKHCGREYRLLACLPCLLQRLDAAELLANLDSIVAISRAPKKKTSRRESCDICTDAIPPCTIARYLGKGVYVHVHCAQRLRDQLEAVRPKRDLAEPGDLELSGSIELD
jgi:hypothetical protein